MNIIIKYLEKTNLVASENILGHNLEICLGTVEGLLSERLSNPKFSGIADSQTGIAPDWQPGPTNNNRGLRYELTKGMFLSGTESQLIHNYGGRENNGIVQTGRIVLAGEQLQVSFWARAQHHPITLQIGIKMAAANGTIYDFALIKVDSPYWKEYKLFLTSPVEDTGCTFFCYLQENGMVWIDQIHMNPSKALRLKEETFKAFQSLDIPVLRFPGGCITTVYHWKYGIGPVHLRPVMADPVFKGETNYEFGTDEYLQMCIELGIQPHITVNISTGTPEEAKEWAEYCAHWYQSRGLDLPLMYWQIGNEHYGYWEIGNMTGEMYVKVLEEFVPGIRSAYPNARIIAIGEERGEGLDVADVTEWRGIVLDKASELFDILAVQCYQMQGWNKDKVVQHYDGLKGIIYFEKTLQSIINDFHVRKLNKRVALTEWNLWYHATHHDGCGFYEPYDVQHGLFVAAVIHMLIGLSPEIEVANFYNLLNPMGVFISHGPEVRETALVEIFRLYRIALPGKVIKLEANSPLLPSGIPVVEAICICNMNSTWLFCINLQAEECINVYFKDFRFIEDGTILAGDGIDGKFHKHHASVEKNSVNLPPLSITRFRIGIK